MRRPFFHRRRQGGEGRDVPLRKENRKTGKKTGTATVKKRSRKED
jgi:hypothetical protein